jgi:hypothetical protein
VIYSVLCARARGHVIKCGVMVHGSWSRLMGRSGVGSARVLSKRRPLVVRRILEICTFIYFDHAPGAGAGAGAGGRCRYNQHADRVIRDC